MLKIGVREGAEEYQLFRVGGSVRLKDGRVVVANTGSRELRAFGPDGAFLNSIGRDGEGPGEFRWPTRIRRLGSDTLMVWDSGLQRISLFDHEGEFLGMAPLRLSSENLFPGDEWIQGRDWIDSPVAPAHRERIRQAVAMLPPVDSVGTLRFVKVTEEGWLWVSPVPPPADSALDWEVYDLDGRRVASVEIPARFQPHEMGPDYVLGRYLDSMDVDYVHLYRLVKPEGSPSPSPLHPTVDFRTGSNALAPTRGRSTVREEVLVGMRAFLRTMAGNQERHYAEHGSYTTSLEQLGWTSRGEAADALEIGIPFAGTQGWMVMVTHIETGEMCVMTYGLFSPMGWSSGMVICP